MSNKTAISSLNDVVSQEWYLYLTHNNIDTRSSRVWQNHTRPQSIAFPYRNNFKPSGIECERFAEWGLRAMREWAGKGLLCLSRRRVRQPLHIPKEPPNAAPSEHQFRVASKLPTQHIVAPILNSPQIATANSCVVEQKYLPFFAQLYRIYRFYTDLSTVEQ